MRRIAAVLISAMIAAACFGLAGCSTGARSMEGSQYVGTWKAVSAVVDGEKADAGKILGGDFTIQLSEDGSASVDMVGEIESGIWSETDEGLKYKGDTRLEFTDNEGDLETEREGVHLIFEKQ